MIALLAIGCARQPPAPPEPVPPARAVRPAQEADLRWIHGSEGAWWTDAAAPELIAGGVRCAGQAADDDGRVALSCAGEPAFVGVPPGVSEPVALGGSEPDPASTALALDADEVAELIAEADSQDGDVHVEAVSARRWGGYDVVAIEITAGERPWTCARAPDFFATATVAVHGGAIAWVHVARRDRPVVHGIHTIGPDHVPEILVHVGPDGAPRAGRWVDPGGRHVVGVAEDPCPCGC